MEIADDSPCAARTMVWAILNINESVSLLGAKSLQLLGNQPYSLTHYQAAMLRPTQLGHGNATALKVLKSADHSGLYTVFGEQGANHQQLLETGRKFICSRYGVAAGESMATPKGQEGKLYVSNIFHR